jgi:hypothetical protein
MRRLCNDGRSKHVIDWVNERQSNDHQQGRIPGAAGNRKARRSWPADNPGADEREDREEALDRSPQDGGR